MNPAQPRRAIFIGDDAPLCQEICSLLEKEKITTTGPSSWEAGLRAIKSQPPDLVMLDLSGEVLALLEQQRGLLAGLEQTPLNAGQQAALAGLKEGWERLSTRLGHLFDFAKAECGSLALKAETFPLLKWLNEILAALEQQA